MSAWEAFAGRLQEDRSVAEIDGINDENAKVGELVKTALSRENRGHWLLIADKADSPELLGGSTNLLPISPSAG